METKPTVQSGILGESVYVPGASPGFREWSYTERKGCKEMRVGVIFQRFRLHPGAVMILAAVAFPLFLAGCGNETPAIEVAVLYWGKVETVGADPVPGRTINFVAVRYTGSSRDDSTLQRRSAVTSTDGRTYLDARFLLGEGQYIILAASTTATDPLADQDHSDVQWITFDDAIEREQSQGGNGLASFVRTVEFTE